MAPLVGVRPIATLQRSADSSAPAAEPRTPAALAGKTVDTGRDFDLAINEPAPEGLSMFASEVGQPRSVPSIQRLLLGAVDERPATPLTLAPRPRETPAGWAEEQPANGYAASGTDFPLAPAPVIIQRIAADQSWDRTAWASVAEPSLQRAPAEAPAVGEAPAGVAVGPTGAASPNGSAFHPPADSHAAEGDMDALAGKLYDRIRSRLKTELLVDRERAGFLTDLR